MGICNPKQGDHLFHAMEQVVPPHGTKCSTLWNKQEGAGFKGRRCRLRGSKVGCTSKEKINEFILFFARFALGYRRSVDWLEPFICLDIGERLKGCL